MTGASHAASRSWTAALVALLALRLALSIATSLAIPLGRSAGRSRPLRLCGLHPGSGTAPRRARDDAGQASAPLSLDSRRWPGRRRAATGDRSFLRANPDMSFAPDGQARNFFVRTTQRKTGPGKPGCWLCARAASSRSSPAWGWSSPRFCWAGQSGRPVPSWPSRPPSFAAFLPESLFVGGAMSNDMMAAMWSTFALWLALSARGWKRALLAGICLGLAFVSKASTGSLAIVSAAALFVNAWPRSTGHRPGARALLPAVGRVAAAGCAALLIAAPWLWRNWQLYGDPAGWSVVLATIDRRQGPLGLPDLAQLLKGWWLSFWGKFGGAGHIPLPDVFYVVWGIMGIASLAGWIRWILRRRDADGLLRQTTLAGWIVLLGAPLVTAAGIFSYSRTALGTDQGRLLFPALGAARAAHHRRPVRVGSAPPRARGRIRFRRRNGAGRDGRALLRIDRSVCATPSAGGGRGGGGPTRGPRFGPLELVASEYGQGEDPVITLYWRAVEPPRDDLRARPAAARCPGQPPVGVETLAGRRPFQHRSVAGRPHRRGPYRSRPPEPPRKRTDRGRRPALP